MDALDDSESNVKISDSAYSNSCSNSQSRRSHSSKSTHSESHSSGSSGYGGKLSVSGSSNKQLPDKIRNKEKKSNKKKQLSLETTTEVPLEVECRPLQSSEPLPSPEVREEVINNVTKASSPQFVLSENDVESMDIGTPEKNGTNDETGSCNIRMVNPSLNLVASRASPVQCLDGFSCVISMHDGVVMYTNSSLTACLGFPKDMWIGRSFIDFIHPKDRNTFASQITSGLAAPINANDTSDKGQSQGSRPTSTMFCRIRRHRGLISGFGVKERIVTFLPFLLKLSFKNISDEEGNITYLVLQATPFFSAYKVPSEIVTKAVPFVMRHIANGSLEYVDSESVPYLGYLPQDIVDKNILQLYHPNDLHYLQKMYELIIREGGVPRSKPYRMMTQNGCYVKLESEWSSFINPWSKKLEFIAAKHHILEGPVNPDVFETPETDPHNIEDEEKTKAQMLRDSIIRIMNEVLTKPVELAKQQMSKRCQDLALFMENLMEDHPKHDEELRLEIQDPDNSCYERDSVMLGGISPHHDCNDSKSSTGTPLSYNQLNYNETLQRYFNSHEPHNHYDEYESDVFGDGENLLSSMGKKALSNCLSPVAQNSGVSAKFTSFCESSGIEENSSPTNSPTDYQPMRLTESLLIKHNSDMEKVLVKQHRETRSSTKGEREKVTKENRKKKKEHLDRCNAAFQPTMVIATTVNRRTHGVKRTSKCTEIEPVANKHQKPSKSSRPQRRKHATSPTAPQPSTTVTDTYAGAPWPTPVSNMNTYISGLGIPSQMSIVNPLVTDIYPMYYLPSPGVSMPSNLENNNAEPTNSSAQYQGPPMQYMMYGQAVFGSPFVYSPINPQMSFPLHQTMIGHNLQYTNTIRPLGLTNDNYEEAAKSSYAPETKVGCNWREKRRKQFKITSSETAQGSGISSSICSSTKALNRESGANSSDVQSIHQSCTMDLSDIGSLNSSKSRKVVTDMVQSSNGQTNASRLGNGEEVRTDGESSYSSFYSSFFKTESGSAEENCEIKKVQDDDKGMNSSFSEIKEKPKRKMDPPWMEQVCVTSELIYKYQIMAKPMEEILSSDRQRMSELVQPSLVNEQLGQLYLDLQLQGVASRLTLEEGITSSASSSEEASNNTPKTQAKILQRKRQYSKLVMIYEEDAPLPSPSPNASAAEDSDKAPES